MKPRSALQMSWLASDVLGSEVGERWNGDALQFVQDMLRIASGLAKHRQRMPTVRRAPASGWAQRWWSILSVAVQHAVGTTVFGRACCSSPLQGPSSATRR